MEEANETNISLAVKKLSPSGLESETERYIRRIYNAEENDIRVDLVIEFAEFLNVDTDKIMYVFYDIAADNL